MGDPCSSLGGYKKYIYIFVRLLEGKTQLVKRVHKSENNIKTDLKYGVSV
jgi:hypothetical protein